MSLGVCLAKFASGFNTQALSPARKDGSYDFGIFQINDKYCRLGSTNSCGVPCTALVQEDITQSAKCAIKIFQKEGFKAWPAFGNNCQAIDTSRFIVKCSLKAESLRRRRFYLNFSDEEE
ncbi:Putative lysozyme C-2 [Araneus ventricosus]|uniref:lysozyme n=1 Tax=Araneus ventricosus TaxID=182803 RepID=A0A4Y2S5E7_ARAVE|nr:Putative lysozyme C-2 [Araneus ventricosus]